MRERLSDQPDRGAALVRAEYLQQDALSYLDEIKNLPSSQKNHFKVQALKQKILSILGGNEDDWQNWKWQLKTVSAMPTSERNS
jgi:hypothetical protein